MALYAILCDLKFFDEIEYEKFCKVDGILGGHPTRNTKIGVEISSGSLGHGPSIGIGKALALKILKSNKSIFVILGDGECNEGTVWEAALSASKNKLNNLTYIIDYNKYQSFGTVSEVCPMEPFSEKWESFGWEVYEADLVQDPLSLKEFLNIKQDKPRVIICHTIKGQGNSILENNLDWHHKSKVSAEEIKLLRENMK